MLAGLDKEHVVQVYETGEREGRSYEIQEFVEHGSLADMVTSDGLPDTLTGVVAKASDWWSVGVILSAPRVAPTASIAVVPGTTRRSSRRRSPGCRSVGWIARPLCGLQ